MKILFDKSLGLEIKGFEDEHTKNTFTTFPKPVDLDIRFESGKLSLNLEAGDGLEVVYRKQTVHKIVRIYAGQGEKTYNLSNYILELDKVLVINIEERK